MPDKLMTVSKAIEALKDVAEAKRKGTPKGKDALLAEEVKKANEVIQKAADKDAADKAVEVQKAADEAAEKRRRELGFAPKGGFAEALQKRGVAAYNALIQKRAGNGDEDTFLRKVHEWNDDVLLASVIMNRNPQDVMKRVPEFREFIEDEIGRSTSELAKAMAAATASQGAEWIPEIWSPDLVDLIRVERVLTGMFRRFPMRAPTVHISTLVTEMQAFVIAESTGNTPFDVPAVISDAGTGTVLLTAVELIVASIFSKTFEEDSIIPALPEIRRRIIEAMAKGIENAIINGSTLGTHPDADVTAATDVQKAWNGLRFTTPTPTTVALDGANMTADNILSLKLDQGRFGARDSDSIYVTSPQGFVKLLGLRGASGDQLLLRADTFGPRAVLNSGALASLFGSDVVVSDLVKTTEDATGVVPAMAGDRTEIIRAHKGAFLIGDRRMLSVESDTQPLTRQRILVATERLIFQRVKPIQGALDRPVTRGVNVETT